MSDIEQETTKALEQFTRDLEAGDLSAYRRNRSNPGCCAGRKTMTAEGKLNHIPLDPETKALETIELEGPKKSIINGINRMISCHIDIRRRSNGEKLNHSPESEGEYGEALIYYSLKKMCGDD